MKIDFRWRDSGPARGKKVPTREKGGGIERRWWWVHTWVVDANQNKVVQISSSGSSSFSNI